MTFNNVVIVGVTRNCEKFICADVERIQGVLSNCKNVSYLIIESDSDDNTIQKLEDLKKTIENFRYISLGELKTRIPKRTERIAFCRNKYLEELENNKLYQNVEYVLISDLDGSNELLSKEAIASCWNISDWDVCTANQFGVYRDIWAFRHPLISPNDYREASRFMVNELGITPKIAKKKLKARHFWFSRSLKPFEVDSAFGGLAIYKRHALKNVKYIGVDTNGSEICEHVALNKQIREKGFKIYLNPMLINCSPSTQYVKSNIKKVLLALRLKYYRMVKD